MFTTFWKCGRAAKHICATQMESRLQNQQMTAMGYISDTEEIVNPSWALFQHNGVAAFKLSERSPLPPPLSAKDLPGGRTQIINVCQIRTINHHAVKSDEDSALESISDTEDWVNWNGDLDNLNNSEDDWVADVESDMEQDNSIEDPDSPEQQDVITAPNLCGLIWPTRKS